MFWHKDIGFRPVEEKDLEDIRNLRNDPTTWAYLTDATQINPAMQKKWFERISKSSTTAYFSVFKTSRDFPVITSDKFIGIIRADEIDVNNRSVRVGCDIVPSERGKGYGTMVFEAILKYWFDSFGMHRVWLCVLENNEIARKLYDNMGLQEEGRLREAIWRDGKYHDYIVMSILAGEYKLVEGYKAKAEKYKEEVKHYKISKEQGAKIKKRVNDYWKSRAKDYDKLDWVKDDGYIKKIIEVGDFFHRDSVLDVGTGTGVVAKSIAHLVKTIDGIDISPEMLPENTHNITYFQKDIRDLPEFVEDIKGVITPTSKHYDKVTARMVFHHIKDGTQLAMDKCFQALKPGGRIIVAENIPPVGNAGMKVIEEYATIMYLKEDRIVFEMQDIIHLMKEAGFVNIEPYHYTIHEFSIVNWLVNNGLSEKLKKQIWDLHLNASDDFKRVSNMNTCLVDNNGCITSDILIDSNHMIITGDKPCT